MVILNRGGGVAGLVPDLNGGGLVLISDVQSMCMLSVETTATSTSLFASTNSQ